LLNMTSSSTEPEERVSQIEFWKLNSVQASIEEMLLDSRAEEISKFEVPEILGYLGPFVKELKRTKGKVRAIELGAGIGRFTGYLADLCSLLTSVDFIKTFVDKNRKINGHRKNVTFRQEDITLLENPRNSFELVFSNWLFMYLSDFEVVQAFFKLIDWLTEGGIFFFRESCYHKSGDRGSSFKNPTHYRTPGDYQRLLYLANLLYKDASTCFKLCTEYVVKAYVKLKNNGNQRVFVCRKVVEQKEKEISQAFQEFLDSQQYSVNNIKRYEQLFGKGFVSTGGLETTKEFALLLDIKKDDFILDVG
jgi:phosphoethanolamine N-methyltransferase